MQAIRRPSGRQAGVDLRLRQPAHPLYRAARPMPRLSAAQRVCRSSISQREDKASTSVRAPGSESNFAGLPKDERDIPVTSSDAVSEQMQERLALVRTNFRFVFKDIMDKDHFQDNIFFTDPISRFTFFRGYQFNVQFLRFFLAPIFEVHDIRAWGKNHIVIKWSWTMNFWWNRYNPFRSTWDPRLAFSGVTIMGFNPATGRWLKHVDAWDNLRNQEFPSLEGYAFVLRQMFQVSKPPNRPTVEFNIMKKFHEWEIRRYKSCPVVATEGEMPADAAEAALRHYFAGQNSSGTRMEWSTPLFAVNDGTFAAVLPDSQEAQEAPRPRDARLSVHEWPGGLFAVKVFDGCPSPATVEAERQNLARLAQQEGEELTKDNWRFARYNDRTWPLGAFRRNEVLLPLNEASFDLWRGVNWDFVEKMVALQV